VAYNVTEFTPLCRGTTRSVVNLGSHTVLVFEEIPSIQKLISYNLEKRGYFVVITDRLSGFSELATLHEPALLLIELSFSKSTDWDMLSALAEDPELMARPTILLTSLSRDDMHYAGVLPANVAATLIKPIVPDKLLGIMREVLNGHGPHS
jgi:DNA-binding response OmpR family regulator